MPRRAADSLAAPRWSLPPQAPVAAALRGYQGRRDAAPWDGRAPFRLGEVIHLTDASGSVMLRIPAHGPSHGERQTMSSAAQAPAGMRIRRAIPPKPLRTLVERFDPDLFDARRPVTRIRLAIGASSPTGRSSRGMRCSQMGRPASSVPARARTPCSRRTRERGVRWRRTCARAWTPTAPGDCPYAATCTPAWASWRRPAAAPSRDACASAASPPAAGACRSSKPARDRRSSRCTAWEPPRPRSCRPSRRWRRAFA